jgi:chromate transport protein ChrA
MVEESLSVMISALVFSSFLLATVFSFNVKKLAKGSHRLMWTILPIACILLMLSALIGAFATTGYLNVFIYDATKKISIIIAGAMLFMFFKETSEVF